MGCTSEQGSDCEHWERPTFSATLSSYYIGKYEVTEGLWNAVMGESSYYKGENYPVDWVSWNSVQEFITKLNSLTGKKYRLPTEAEWEFAARGGRSSKGYKYSGSNTVGNVAWYSGNSSGSIRPVGTKAANELGIYDMSGNVAEWCSDWREYYTSTAKTNPTGPSSGDYRVIRGGSINPFELARDVRVSRRDWGRPDGGGVLPGFRLALSAN